MNELATTNGRGEVIEAVIAKGDLAKLTEMERVNYYRAVCESVGLNPLTRPFEYITLQGKVTLYARKDATDQLRTIKGISLHIDQIDIGEDLVVVTVSATDKTGRSDSDVGAVAINNLRGEAKANAIMKAITKAKRRVTLSCAGLGWLDETETEAIPDARPVRVDAETGEIVEPALPTPKTTAQRAAAALAWAQEKGLKEDDARGLLNLAKGNNGGKLNDATADAIFSNFRSLVEEAAQPELA